MQRASVEGRVHQKWIKHPKTSFHDNTCFDVRGPCNVNVHRPSSLSLAPPPGVISTNDSPSFTPLPSFCLCTHLQHIFLFFPHLPYSCPPHLVRYTLLGGIDQTFHHLCPLWSLQHPQPLRLTRILLSPSLIRVHLPALTPLPVPLNRLYPPLDRLA